MIEFALYRDKLRLIRSAASSHVLARSIFGGGA